MIESIGVGAQSTLGGMCEKNYNMPEFYVILARKICKIPEFLSYFSEKN